MHRSTLFSLILLNGASIATAAAVEAQSAPESTVDRLLQHVTYLASDVREGRGVGTSGLDSAAAYIARAFARLGLEPGGTAGFLQPFTLDSTAPTLAHSGLGGLPVANVIGILPGRGSLAGQAVIVGAHYDHLGLGGFGSLDPDSTGVVHNGADDNASGTAALIETARALASRTHKDARSVVFVAFTAEELGLLGSMHYVKNPVFPSAVTAAMINFDMVGRLREGRLLAIGTGSAEELPDLVTAAAGTHGVEVRVVPDPWGRSDHSSFYGEAIPVVHFFTDTHEDYHRTTDDAPAINLNGLARVVNVAADLVWSIATRPERLTYAEVAPPQPTTGGGYGAYLGTIPDMSESPGGVRITGVRSGSPAETAGLHKGDIIVRIGSHDIENLYHMTDALRAHRPGDEVIVVVVRDGERLELAATLGKRGG